MRTEEELYTVEYFVSHFEIHRHEIDFYYACTVNAFVGINAEGRKSDVELAQILRNAREAYESIRFRDR